MMTVEDVCKEIVTRREAAVSRRIEAYPRNNPVASDLGPCAREMTLAMTHWQVKPPLSVELKERFDRGNAIEDLVLNELATLGIRVRVDRKAFEIKDTKGRVVLRGRLDGFAEFDRQQFPMEVKSVDANVFRRIETAADFDRFPWARKWPRQLQSYCYAENFEAGFFLLDDCMGHWKLVPVYLDFEEMEQILRRCEAAVEHRDAGTLPDFIDDVGACNRCWARGRVCFPPRLGADGLRVLDDAELEALLVRREALREAAHEYEGVDKAVKAAVKGRTDLLVGDFLVTGKEITRKSYVVKEGSYWKAEIERLTPKADAAA